MYSYWLKALRCLWAEEIVERIRTDTGDAWIGEISALLVTRAQSDSFRKRVDPTLLPFGSECQL
jgi:hypothetical protein